MNNSKSLFITDALHTLNPKKDTTILWMQEIAEQNGQVFQCEISDLIYCDDLTQANASEIPNVTSQPQITNTLDENILPEAVTLVDTILAALILVVT